MKLELKELRMLTNINCYNSKFRLTKNEIDDDEEELCIKDWNNLKVTISDWFCDYMGDRVYSKEHNGKTFYFFRRGSSLVEGFEFENIVKKVLEEYELNSAEEFDEIVKNIFQENDYNPEDDWFDEYDEDSEEE